MPAACSVTGCQRPFYAKGLCNLHWGRVRRHGDPNIVKPGNVKHRHAAGNTRSHEYRCWEAMKARCLNPRATNFQYYGGRGIRVFGPWVESFAAFLAAVGSAPSTSHTLDRKANDGHYEPGNVRWATKVEQAGNRRHASVAVGGW